MKTFNLFISTFTIFCTISSNATCLLSPNATLERIEYDGTINSSNLEIESALLQINGWDESGAKTALKNLTKNQGYELSTAAESLQLRLILKTSSLDTGAIPPIDLKTTGDILSPFKESSRTIILEDKRSNIVKTVPVIFSKEILSYFKVKIDSVVQALKGANKCLDKHEDKNHPEAIVCNQIYKLAINDLVSYEKQIKVTISNQVSAAVAQIPECE